MSILLSLCFFLDSGHRSIDVVCSHSPEVWRVFTFSEEECSVRLFLGQGCLRIDTLESFFAVSWTPLPELLFFSSRICVILCLPAKKGRQSFFPSVAFFFFDDPP